MSKDSKKVIITIQTKQLKQLNDSNEIRDRITVIALNELSFNELLMY